MRVARRDDGTPISCAMACDKSSFLAWKPSLMRLRSAMRDSKEVAEKEGNAVRAAVTARSTSAALAAAIWVKAASVAGSMTSSTAPVAGACQRPSM